MTKQVSHQTVRLSRGSHTCARAGMCVMELASVLSRNSSRTGPAQSRLSLALFSGGTTTRLTPTGGRTFTPYAANAVGTRRKRKIERRRAAHCLAVSRSIQPWLGLSGIPQRLSAMLSGSGAGAYAAFILARPNAHSTALALLDDLVRMGGIAVFPDTAPPSWRPAKR